MTQAKLAADTLALTIRPTVLDDFAVFLELAVPHFEGGDLRVAAGTALATAVSFDALVGPPPPLSAAARAVRASQDSTVSSGGDGGGRISAAGAAAAASSGSARGSGSGSGSAGAEKDSGGVSRASSASKSGGGGDEDMEDAAKAKVLPAPTLAEVTAAHARYEKEAAGAREHAAGAYTRPLLGTS